MTQSEQPEAFIPERILAFKRGLTVNELASLLHVERRTIIKAINRRGLPALKMGSNFRLDPTLTARWVQKHLIVRSPRKTRTD